jgi:hypothetical protein
MPFDGYSGDLNWSSYTPADSTGTNYDIFSSAYKNIRFNVQSQSQYQITVTDMANLPVCGAHSCRTTGFPIRCLV